MSDKDLPIGYRNTENPDVIEVFYFVKAQVRRDAITHDHGRIVTAMQLYEAGARVAHDRMVKALFAAPEYEERDPLSRTELVSSCWDRP